VAIRASASPQIGALIADLAASRAVVRETAVARLTLLGARAVERLIAAAAAGAPEARAAAWRTLEAIGDRRALDPALAALTDEAGVVAAAAAGVARVHLRGPHGARAIDQLATVLLDRARHEPVRLAALRALRELPAATIAPILAALAGDPNAAIRTEAGLSPRSAPQAAEDPAAEVARAAGGALPDDPAALRHALNLAGGTVPLASLQKVVDRVREREGAEPAAARDQWRLARAAAHTALAHRGSRIALYDLRESIAAAKGPLPVEFLAAVARLGDASCVEAIAAAHARARDAWSRHHLADAFYAIVQREKLTSRHAVMKRVAKHWPNGLTRSV
jgi:hypothetical protein